MAEVQSPTRPPRIQTIVAARSVAQKIKYISSGLHSELRKRQDKGDFAVTFTDDPTTPHEDLRPPVVEPSHFRGRRSTISHGRTASIPSVSAFQASIPEIPQTPQNTYRMEPIRKFEDWKVREIIRETFEEKLEDKSYDREFCNQMSKTLADSIKEQVKSLQFSRYKIISIVTIGQKRDQSARVASRCVWDERFDSFAQYSLERGDMYAVGVVYGIYCE